MVLKAVFRRGYAEAPLEFREAVNGEPNGKDFERPYSAGGLIAYRGDSERLLRISVDDFPPSQSGRPRHSDLSLSFANPDGYLALSAEDDHVLKERIANGSSYPGFGGFADHVRVVYRIGQNFKVTGIEKILSGKEIIELIKTDVDIIPYRAYLEAVARHRGTKADPRLTEIDWFIPLWYSNRLLEKSGLEKEQIAEIKQELFGLSVKPDSECVRGTYFISKQTLTGWSGSVWGRWEIISLKPRWKRVRKFYGPEAEQGSDVRRDLVENFIMSYHSGLLIRQTLKHLKYRNHQIAVLETVYPRK